MKRSAIIATIAKTEAPVQNLDPDYSADGTRLVFSRQGALSPSATTGAGLFLMKATPGATPFQLTSTSRGAGDRAPAFSPSGKQIAFQSDRAGSADLYVLTLGQLGMTRLTWSKYAEREPSWSPDGASLVYLNDQTGYTELWVLPLQGMNVGPPQPWQLTFDKLTKGAPDWQPAAPALNG